MARSAILSIRIVSNAKDAERGIDKTNRNLSRLERHSKNSGVQLARMYQKMDGAARAATRVGALTIAAQALTVQAVRAGAALAPLAALVGAIPGAAAAGGAAMATLAVATNGVGEAMDAAQKGAAEFEDAIKDMPRSMQASVRAMADLRRQFGAVAKSVQSAFWADLDRDIRALGNAAFPVLNREMTRTAASMNGFARELLRAAGSESTMAAMAASFRLAQRAIDNLTPAVAPVVDGIARIVKESANMQSGFLGAEGAAKKFQSWTKRITSDGSLRRWFEQGKEAADALGRVIGGVARIIGGIGKAALDAGGPGGGLGQFADNVNRIADAINRPEIQKDLTESFRRANKIAGEFVGFLIKILPFLARWGPELVLVGAAWRVATGLMAGYRFAMSITGALHTAMAGKAVKDLAKVAGGWVKTAATALVQAGRMALAWFIALGPVGWAIAAIVAVGAAFVIAYAKCEWFRDRVNAVVRAVAGFLARLWSQIVQGASSAFRSAAGFVAGFVRSASGYAAAAKGAFSRAWSAIVAAAAGMLSRVRGVFSSVAGAARAAGATLSGAITGAIRRVSGAFGGIAGAARSAFGGAVNAARWAMGQISYAVSWIRNAAARVSGVWSSLWSSGLMYQRAAVASTLPEVGQPFYLHAAGSVLSPATWGGARESAKPTVINVTVQGAIDPNETARQIKRILDRDSKRDGNSWIGAPAW